MQPAAVFAGLSAFLVYSTWAAFQGEHYTFGNYFLYLALGFIVFLSYDVWNALWSEDAAGGASFGVGVGTLVLACDRSGRRALYTDMRFAERNGVGAVLRSVGVLVPDEARER